MKVYANEFNMAVANVSKAVSKDEYRPTFQKIHMVGADDGIMIESCDGFRIHRTSIYVIDSVEPFDILVDKLEKVPKGIKEVTIKFEDNKLVVNDIPYNFENNVKGKYLDTEEAFPKRNVEMCIIFNVKYLKEALQHISTTELGYGGGRVELRFEKDAKTGGIDPLKPIVLSSGISHNVVLPMRPNWR